MLFYEKLMLKIDICQRRSIIMIDEVYIKLDLLCHEHTQFGKSVNHPDKQAKTMLAYMVKFLYIGPELIAKILPVSVLYINLQLSQCQPIFDTIRKQQSGEALATMADDNRVSQSFLKKMEIVEEKPWIGKDRTFLLSYLACDVVVTSQLGLIQVGTSPTNLRRHHDVATGTLMRWTYLRRLCDTSLVRRKH